MGLDQLDRRFLALVAKRPVGIEVICAALDETRSTIEELVEPFLLANGFIARTVCGRVATDRAHN